MLEPLLAHWRERPQRTWSLVATVFGDAIVPRGGHGMARHLAKPVRCDGHRCRGCPHGDVPPGCGWLDAADAGGPQQRLLPGGEGAWPRRRRRRRASMPGQPPAWDGRFQPGAAARTIVKGVLEADGYGQAAPGPVGRAGTRVAQPAEPITLDAAVEPSRRPVAGRDGPGPWSGSRPRSHGSYRGVRGRCLDWRDPAMLEAMVARTVADPRIPADRAAHTRCCPPRSCRPNWPGTAARELCAAAYTRVFYRRPKLG